MNVIAFFIQRWQFTLVLFALLTLLGLSAFVITPRSEDPHFPIPIISVKIVLPGASPGDIEQLITKKIEDALYRLDDIKSIKSTSIEGVSVLQVEFSWHLDPARKYDEVVREVNAVRATLPSGVARVDIARARTTEVAAFQVALVSEYLPMRRLEKLARRLTERLNQVNGVREARYWGAPASELRISLDMPKLAQLKLPASTIVESLRGASDETPIGIVHAGDRRYSVRAGGAFSDIAQVQNLPIIVGGANAPNARNANASGEAGVARLREIAEVSWETEEPEHLTRFNGKRALFITATQRDLADVTTLTREANVILDDFEKTLPAGVKLARGFYQAENVARRLNNLYWDFAIAIVLVLLTLLPLGLRAGVVVMLSIPMSLLIGLTLTNAFGFSLNQLTISGFVLSLGLLVDDSIVVTENIARHIRNGESKTTAAIFGTQQILMAVMGCTACLLLGFLPLLALPEGAGGYIKSLPVAVFCTVGASFFVSITIIPFLASRLLSTNEPAEGNWLLRKINTGIQGFYRPVLHRSMEHPKTTIALLVAVCFTAIPMLMQAGTSLFPPAQTPQFLVRVELADGAALRETDAALRFAEQEVAATPHLKWMASNLGRGNPQIFYNLPQRETDAKFAEIFASFTTWQPVTTDQHLEDLRNRLRSYPGANISVVTFQNGPPVEAPIAIRFSGEDLTTLKALASQTELILRNTLGTRDVFNPLRVDRTDLNLGINEDKAALLGVRAGDNRRTTRLALQGEATGRFRDADGDDYPVKVRLPMQTRNENNIFSSIYLSSSAGEPVQLGSIAAPAFQTGIARIDRYNRERSVTVTAYIETGALTSAVSAATLKNLKEQLQIPLGYTLAVGGEAESQAKAVNSLGTAIIISVFGILAVLILEFRRFRAALIVAAIVPLGVFGAISAIWISGNSLSFTAIVGIIALIGIEIKNSILLVDFTEQLRSQGVSIREAIEQAGETRFLPVLLTSITAIGGLIPLALEGSGLFSPLAIAIIGGLISSTILSRVATPVMYLLLSSHNPWRRNSHPHP